MRKHIVVMVTSSYPRFPGDTVGTFMEPIAHGVAARGHEVHVVAPWHPDITRAGREDGVSFHFYRYAPHPALNVFGYAGALREDTALRATAWAAAPLALASGWRCARRVARQARATVMHGHWVVPGGVTAWTASPRRPLVVSLHGSDVYVAERHGFVGRVARAVFNHAARITACSEDLRRRAVALGAARARIEVVPYGVDTSLFQPASDRLAARSSLGLPRDAPLVFSVGRFVRKKGFEYLIDAVAQLAASRRVQLVLAGGGDLELELRDRAAARGVSSHVRFPGVVDHGRVAQYCAAADVIAVPSIHDDEGNVDGLPNVLLEALASATPVVATTAGGIGSVVQHDVTGWLVPERDADALARAIAGVLDAPARGRAVGAAARADMAARFGWARVAERFEAAYDAAVR